MPHIRHNVLSFTIWKSNLKINILTLNWFIAASSSANACSFKLSSIPFACESSRPLAMPNALLVVDKADTPDRTFFWLL